MLSCNSNGDQAGALFLRWSKSIGYDPDLDEYDFGVIYQSRQELAMNAPEKPRTSVPSASEYILDNFKPTDRIAVLVLNRQSVKPPRGLRSAKSLKS